MNKINDRIIKVFEIIGMKDIGFSESGKILFKNIMTKFYDSSSNDRIVLDFSKIKIVTYSFLSFSVGYLYNNYDSEFLNKNLTIINMQNEDKKLLKKVISEAKKEFKNKKD